MRTKQLTQYRTTALGETGPAQNSRSCRCGGGLQAALLDVRPDLAQHGVNTQNGRGAAIRCDVSVGLGGVGH